MQKHTKYKSLLLALSLSLITLASGCGNKSEDTTEVTTATTEVVTEAATETSSETSSATDSDVPHVENLSLIHEPEFGGAYITMTIDDFNNLGFEYGDSVDIVFSNGYEMIDVPYYNGYFAVTGDAFLVGYPGYDYIKACICNGDDLWEVADLPEDGTADIKLHEAKKYLEIRNARSLEFDTDRENFTDDATFGNFRNIATTGIKPGVLYRSASPIDNVNNRAQYVDKLCSEAGIKTIYDLSDTDETVRESMAAEDYNSPYFKELYENGNVVFANMRMNYTSDTFKKDVADIFKTMPEKEGPYIIQCTEGKDRTGILCVILESLCGASYDELASDYMRSYEDAYHLSSVTDAEKYNIIQETEFDNIVKTMVGDESVDHKTADLSGYANQYLLDGGMTQDEIDSLKKILMQ